jgi:hypothetical protein
VCNLFAFVLGGLFAGVLGNGGRPILKKAVKTGIAAKRKVEEAGRRVKEGFNDIVADAEAELDLEREEA